VLARAPTGYAGSSAVITKDLHPFPIRSPERAVVREIGARARDSLIEAMGQALQAVSVRDVRGFFAHRGYRTPEHQS